MAGSTYACGTGATALTAADVLATMPSSFIDRTLQFDATVSLFEKHLAGVGSTTSDLENYFTRALASAFDNACFTVAEYTSEAAAQAAAAQVAAGTPFAQVASQVTGGGPQGCDILYGIASSLPTGSNLQESAPQHRLEPDSGQRQLSPDRDHLTDADVVREGEVRGAGRRRECRRGQGTIGHQRRGAQSDRSASMPRYGTWVPAKAEVLPPTSPPVIDVLNPVANNPGSVAATSSTASSGQNS